MMQTHGWIYYGEGTIDKNPQVKAVRTKDSGLMFKSLATDAWRACSPALSDQLLQFRAPGECGPRRSEPGLQQSDTARRGVGNVRGLDSLGTAGVVRSRLPAGIAGADVPQWHGRDGVLNVAMARRGR